MRAGGAGCGRRPSCDPLLLVRTGEPVVTDVLRNAVMFAAVAVEPPGRLA